jgi:hypothetical protein
MSEKIRNDFWNFIARQWLRKILRQAKSDYIAPL